MSELIRFSPRPGTVYELEPHSHGGTDCFAFERCPVYQAEIADLATKKHSRLTSQERMKAIYGDKEPAAKTEVKTSEIPYETETEGFAPMNAAPEEPPDDDDDDTVLFVPKALDEISELLQNRGHAYAYGGEFENFEMQARTAEVELRQVFRGMLGQKLNRESTVRRRLQESMRTVVDGIVVPDSSVDELQASRLDSVRDIAGYAILWYAWELSLQDD